MLSFCSRSVSVDHSDVSRRSTLYVFFTIAGTAG